MTTETYIISIGSSLIVLLLAISGFLLNFWFKKINLKLDTFSDKMQKNELLIQENRDKILINKELSIEKDKNIKELNDQKISEISREMMGLAKDMRLMIKTQTDMMKNQSNYHLRISNLEEYFKASFLNKEKK